MRRFLVILLALSAFTGTAYAGGWIGSDEDGTLSVRNADGTAFIRASGVVVGHFDHGYVRVFDPVDGDELDVNVWGEERTQDLKDGATTIYSGTNVRFRIVGKFRIRVVATGVDLSVVGQGRIGLNGDAGTYSLNGKARKAMPSDPTGALTYADLGVPDSG